MHGTAFPYPRNPTLLEAAVPCIPTQLEPRFRAVRRIRKLRNNTMAITNRDYAQSHEVGNRWFIYKTNQ